MIATFIFLSTGSLSVASRNALFYSRPSTDRIPAVITAKPTGSMLINLHKSCCTIYNAPSSASRSDIAIHDQLLLYDPKPCYLGVCLSNKADQNSIMLQKASRAACALRSMIDNTAAASVINKLFEQLIEPILLYAVEQWLPYTHPRKVDKLGPIDTFSALSSQLNTEEVWKKFIYSHYTLSETTPVLAVHVEIGSYPTFVAGMSPVWPNTSLTSHRRKPPPPPPPPGP